MEVIGIRIGIFIRIDVHLNIDMDACTGIDVHSINIQMQV